ncbi:MAG TPA: hypothetical protein VGZ49_05170, partial [Xanthobacteraceae bacterium]|nr:hypothetical protein [Xanthobacteraceae bacterium]
LHWMSSIIYLATASERLREFFISAVFRKSQTAYKRGVFLRQDRGLYPTPFLEAKERLRVPELTDALAKACPLAEEIRRLRGSRNEIVHEIATAMGRRERQIIDERPQFADPGDFDFPSFKNAIAEGEALHRQRLDETIKRLGDWYALLARASNEAFIVENRLRKYTDIPLIPWGL